MSTSWADSVSASENAAPASSNTSALPRPTRSTYVPPHLRNKPPTSSEPPASSRESTEPASGPRWGSGSRPDFGRGQGYGSGGRSGSGWNNRSGGWDRREREVNPFGDDVGAEQPVAEEENTGINFDAYEDIPVETSGENVPPAVNTFAEIDLGEALNLNITRCKYVKPTPIQRHAIPISIAGRDLMACAQTGSGKTAAFCFPIISGIMREQYVQRPRGSRTVYPLALILAPTRELSSQVGFLFGPLHFFKLGNNHFVSFMGCRSMLKPRNFPIKLVSRWWLLTEEHQSTNRFPSFSFLIVFLVFFF